MNKLAEAWVLWTWDGTKWTSPEIRTVCSTTGYGADPIPTAPCVPSISGTDLEKWLGSPLPYRYLQHFMGHERRVEVAGEIVTQGYWVLERGIGNWI